MPEASHDSRTIEPSRGLRRVLRLQDLVLLIVGTVIGSGIFLVPGLVLKTVGNSVPMALTAWIAGGILSLLGGLTYGELSARNPQAGGLYVYIRDSFGDLPAFLFGWILFFVVSTGSIATLAVAFNNYLTEIFPLGFWTGKVISLLLVGLIAWLNVRGTRQSADVQNVATVIKALAILSMAGALLWFGSVSRVFSLESAGAVSIHSRFSVIALATISVLWAYEGWQYATFAAGETVNPRRDFPIAFTVGILVLIALYILSNLGYLAALGPAGVANSSHVASTALSTISGALAKALTFAILLSIFSAANSIMLTAPRVYFAMAKDRLFFPQLAEVHPRYGTPAFAVIATAFWASVLAVTGTFEQLLTYVVFVGWTFYALAAASIFIYRSRESHVGVQYRVPGYPWTPLAFIVAVAAVVVNTIVAQPARAAIGLVVVFTGIPAYLVWRRR